MRDGRPAMSVKSRTRQYGPALQRLRAARLRPTRQRLALAYLLFERGDRHVSAEELHAEAAAARVTVSLATVYNTLHQFIAAGLLREVVVASGRSYFDTNVTQHHHFYHEDSGALQDIAGTELALPLLPRPPSGTAIARVDVIVRLRKL